MAYNWYLVLELEFDPNPVNDETIIRQRIDDKKRFWSRNKIDMKYGQLYGIYLDMIDDISTAMLSADTRKLLAADAKRICAPIDRLLNSASLGNGEIKEDVFDRIAKQYKNSPAITKDFVGNRAKQLGYKVVSESGADYQSIYKKYYETPPDKPADYATIQNLLGNLPGDADNLYAFLFPAHPTYSKLTLKELLARADELNKSRVGIHDGTTTVITRLCKICEKIFDNDATRAEYDRYLAYDALLKTSDEYIKTIFEVSGKQPLSQSYRDEAIGAISKLVGNDINLASQLFIAYCKNGGISFAEPQAGRNVVLCRYCSSVNENKGRLIICFNCNIELNCPACKHLNEPKINRCESCGLNLANVAESVERLKIAKDLVESMSFSAAESQLGEAARLWPTNPEIPNLKARLKAQKDKIGPRMQEIRDAAVKKNFYEAGEKLKALKADIKEISDPALEQEIRVAVDNAAQAYKKAQDAIRTNNEKEIIDNLISAFDRCRDYPGIRAQLEQYPPEPPRDIVVKPDPDGRKNIIQWVKSSSYGLVDYVIVRKENASPKRADDGVVFDPISVPYELYDSKIKPGVAYFYGVFARRADILSRPLISADPVINLFEIQGLSITPNDSTLELRWEVLPQGATAEIYRQSGTQAETYVHSTTASSFKDIGLVNQEIYTYTVKLVYIIGGKQLRTTGAREKGSPYAPPSYIKTLRIKAGHGDIFEAAWANPDGLQVDLFGSFSKPIYTPGDIIPRQEFLNKMNIINLNRLSDSAAAFTINSDETLYVHACIVTSDSVVVGASARASKVKGVTIASVVKDGAGNRLRIRLENPPKTALGFLVMHHPMDYPDIGETAEVYQVKIPMQRYISDGGLHIESLESRDYYISIVAIFEGDGEFDYSTPSHWLYKNTPGAAIIYSIKTSMFSSGVTIVFESASVQFYMPDVEIRYAIGSMPMNRSTAKLYWEVEGQPVRGSLRISCFGKLPKNAHIKPFLKDETQREIFQLRPKTGTKHKVT
ncbi:MAG: zinc ribbon domain-containing protein [Defluviitaleaceae bacterium]|nr:zinc ribbon domain-containing protein [Defluviitaleaceae bacterium]